MKLHTQQKTPEQMVAAIFALDLDPIKFKLMDKKEGLGWTREQADRLELEYRRFLALTAKYPEEVIAPSSEVDKFWHGHILDTMKYAEDCQRIFGHFLHHFPYFGMRDAEDAANLVDAATNTRRLYEQEFGGAVTENAAYCARVAADTSAYCARVVGAEVDAAYCARVAAPTGVAEDNTAYCARVAGQPGTAAETDAAYCARVAGPASMAEDSAAYCARVAGKADTSQDAAYCARATAGAGYYATVLGKGRPTLESAAA